MGKGKPKWNSLPSRERFVRKVKSCGFSDYIVNRIRESNNKDYADEDYWKATEGNAKSALCGLLAFAQMRPDGVWKVY